MPMRSLEKIEMLKSTITHLYSKEGRSISYISRLLEVNRKNLSYKIKEWKLEEAEPRRHLTPSKKKFLNNNRSLIKARLDKDVPISVIADELKVSRNMLYKTIIPNDEVLLKAHDDYIARIHNQVKENIEALKRSSRLEYEIDEIDNEIWKPIVGFEDYDISSEGRVRGFSKSYNSYYLLKPQPNKNNGRLYVTLSNEKGRKNLQVARLVGFAFVDGYDEEHNIINYEDGDESHNYASNLTWVSQSENNKHSYIELNRPRINRRRYIFSKIVYQDKYEFKTVAAFARFLGLSETQTRRYLDHPKRYGIKLID